MAAYLIVIAMALAIGAFTPAIAGFRLASALPNGDQIALVITNIDYPEDKDFRELGPNDAEFVSNALRRRGFVVHNVTEADAAAMRVAIERFSVLARKAKIALVYYTGEAAMIGGHRYLVPITEAGPDYDRTRLIRLDDVIASTQTVARRVFLLNTRFNGDGEADESRDRLAREPGLIAYTAMIPEDYRIALRKIGERRYSAFGFTTGNAFARIADPLPDVIAGLEASLRTAVGERQHITVAGSLGTPSQAAPVAVPAAPLVVTTAVAATATPVARPERRLALVVGNSAYTSGLGALANPIRDAKLLAEALRKAGFEVELQLDADRNMMFRAVAGFGDRIASIGKGADTVALFYYAGHGAQSEGESYLIPVRSDIADAADLQINALGAKAVIDRMRAGSPAMTIVILDACRDVPMRRATRSTTRGLARIEAPGDESVIAYSTRPGSVAEDGSGQNSVYAIALAEEITRPGQLIETAFRRVTGAVRNATSERQSPQATFDLVRPFAFTPGPTSQ